MMNRMNNQEIPLLRRYRLFEADPSPALWAAPFSKGRALTVASIEGLTFHVRQSVPMQALGEGPRQSRRMD